MISNDIDFICWFLSHELWQLSFQQVNASFSGLVQLANWANVAFERFLGVAPVSPTPTPGLRRRRFFKRMTCRMLHAHCTMCMSLHVVSACFEKPSGLDTKKCRRFLSLLLGVDAALRRSRFADKLCSCSSQLCRSIRRTLKKIETPTQSWSRQKSWSCFSFRFFSGSNANWSFCWCSSSQMRGVNCQRLVTLSCHLHCCHCYPLVQPPSPIKSHPPQ